MYAMYILTLYTEILHVCGSIWKFLGCSNLAKWLLQDLQPCMVVASLWQACIIIVVPFARCVQLYKDCIYIRSL